MHVPDSAALEEAGNARHSRAALYPMGDNGRRAERQGCAWGHVPHQHITPYPHCLDRKQLFLSCLPPPSPPPHRAVTLLCSALVFLLQSHVGRVKPVE